MMPPVFHGQPAITGHNTNIVNIYIYIYIYMYIYIYIYTHTQYIIHIQSYAYLADPGCGRGQYR